MARKGMTVERYNEIKRLIESRLSDRQIARGLKYRRATVSEIREGNKGHTRLFLQKLYMN